MDGIRRYKNMQDIIDMELEEYIPLPAACRPFVGADGRGSLFPSAAGTVSGLWLLHWNLQWV